MFKHSLNNSKRILYFGILPLSISFVVCIILSLINYPWKETEDNVTTFSAAFSEFQKQCAANDLITLPKDTKDFWPQEYVYANTGEGKIYFCLKDSTSTFVYESFTSNQLKTADDVAKNTIKILKKEKGKIPQDKYDNLSNLYREYQLGELEIRLPKEYISALDSFYKVGTNNPGGARELTRLYNVLVGDTAGHVVIRLKKEKKPTVLQTSDFPQYELDSIAFITFVQKHAIEKTDSSLLSSLLQEKVLIPISYHFYYADYRKDRLYVNNKWTPLSELKDGDKAYYDRVLHNPKFAYNPKTGDIRAYNELTETSKNLFVIVDEDAMSKVKIAHKQPIWKSMLIVSIVFFILLLITITLWVFVIIFSKDKNTNETEPIKTESAPTEEPQKPVINATPVLDKEKLTKIELSDKILTTIEEHPKDLTTGMLLEVIEDIYPTTQASLDDMRKRIYKQQEKDKEEAIQNAIQENKGTLENKVTELQKENSTLKPKAKQYDELTSLTKEKDLIATLNTIHENNPRFPVLRTLQIIFNEAKEDASKKKKQNPKISVDATILQYIMREVVKQQSDASDTQAFLEKLFDIYKKYSELKRKYFVNTNSSIAIDLSQLTTKIKDAKDYQQLTQAIASILKPEDGSFDNIMRLQTNYNDMQQHFIATQNLVQQYSKSYLEILQESSLNFFDRLLFISSLINDLSMPLFNSWGVKIQFSSSTQNIIDNLKSDMMQLLITRTFFSELLSSNGSTEHFQQTISTNVAQAIEKYNNSLPNKASALRIDIRTDKQTTERTQLLTDVLKHRFGNDIFVKAMWEKYVQSFTQKTHDNDSIGQLLETMMGLSYYTIDYVAAMQGQRSNNYYPNFCYMISQFNLQKTNEQQRTDIKPFTHNDFEFSNNMSNKIYELSQQFDIPHLDFIVDNYLIKK